MLIAINDVCAIKLRVKSGDYVKIKQEKTYFTCTYFFGL